MTEKPLRQTFRIYKRGIYTQNQTNVGTHHNTPKVHKSYLLKM